LIEVGENRSEFSCPGWISIDNIHTPTLSHHLLLPSDQWPKEESDEWEARRTKAALLGQLLTES